MSNIQTRLYTNLDPEKWPHQGLSQVNKIILSLIILSVFVAIIESEPNIKNISLNIFYIFNFIFAVLFSIEYILRVWAMGKDPRYAGIAGRVQYALVPASLIDLIATLALWAGLMFGIQGILGVMLRLVRVLRVLRLARNSAWATAIKLLVRATANRKHELILSLGLAGIILLVSATLLFAVEGTAQPEAFGNIPRSMWWAMATLTTIGYGDVYPITAAGRICASVAAITSIGIVAMPTGIMATAFSDAFQNLHKEA